MPKYKISKKYLIEFFGLFGKRKEDRQEKINQIIDNDPILKKLDKQVGDINRAARKRLEKTDPELLKLLDKYN
jgi:hypothetical protein